MTVFSLFFASSHRRLYFCRAPGEAASDLITVKVFIGFEYECPRGHRYTYSMDQITIKTPDPKCRLYWCFIEFIDWRYSQSCWYFRPLLLIIASLTFSLVDLPLPPSLCEYAQGYVIIQCEIEGMGPQTYKHLPPNPFTCQFLRKDDLEGLVSL